MTRRASIRSMVDALLLKKTTKRVKQNESIVQKCIMQTLLQFKKWRTL